MNLLGFQKPFLLSYISCFVTIILLTSKSLLENESPSGALENILQKYTTFLLMTLLFDILLQEFAHCRINSSGIQLYKNQQSLFWRIKRTRAYFLTSLVRFSLVFCLYQALCIWISPEWNNNSSQTPSSLLNFQSLTSTGNQFQQALMSNRILEEGEQSSLSSIKLPNDAASMTMKFKKPSLSIGKIVSEIDIEVNSMKLSNDEKTAFVVTNFPATLKIIDISDLEYPVILSSLPLVPGIDYKIFKSITVSNDEDLLYISNVQYLEIINISDLRSPICIAVFEDKKMIYKGQDFGAIEISKPTLAISKDKKVLFIAGIGLQIFDISKPATPVLLNSTPSQAKLPASLAIHGDELFYSDGSLWIYNISDPRNMKLMNCFNKTYPITSMIVSKEKRVAFVLTTEEDRNTVIQVLNISEDAKSIKVNKRIFLEEKRRKHPIFLEQTPKDLFLFIMADRSSHGSPRKLLIFDNMEERLISHNKMLIQDCFSVLFTRHSEKVLIGANPNLKLANLYLDYPNKHAFTRSSNILKSFDIGSRYLLFDFMELSQNEGIIFSIILGLKSQNVFGIQKVTMTKSNEATQLTNISFYNPEMDVDQMMISRDKTRAFLTSRKKTKILDISDPENIILLGEYLSDDGNQIKSSMISGDGKTGYFVEGDLSENFLKIVDFSEPQNPIEKASLPQGLLSGFSSKLILSKDEKMLFLINSKLWIFNVSNAASPVLLRNISFARVEGFLERGVLEGLISPDGNTLFIKEGSGLNYATVHILDISGSPMVLSEFHYPFGALDNYYSGRALGISPDSNTLFIVKNAHLMVVDVSNKTSPKFLGEVQVLNIPDFSSTSSNAITVMITNLILSADGTKAYIPASSAKLHIVSIQPLFSTFIKQEALMLGERHSQDIMVLKMDEDRDFNMMEADYKFTKFALVKPHSIQNANFEDVELNMAPSWMSFDLKSQTLTVEARRKNDIGTYRVYFGFSTQLSVDVFSKINDTLNSNDLMTTLIGLGYVDNELFLTENFGKETYFLLPSRYSDIRKQVYGILKRYSFETFNEIEIVKSLEVFADDENKLKIQSANPSSLKVDIILAPEQPKQAQFLSRYYGYLFPSITADKSRITLEGSMTEINLVLQEVVVNLENITTCGGQIMIDDKLNPILNEYMSDITQFFHKNAQPELSNNSVIGTLQSQISKNPVWTGQYFQIKLSQHTFFDKFTLVENLNYQLIFVEKGEETSILPNWISLSDMDLIGTAPESIFGRDYEFEFVVKNEFREYKEPFTLHVKISTSFVLKLLMKYSPYVLSIVGLWISANKIFNVIFKGRYKHPKEFNVRIGEEITDEVIFPVSFIREEISEAKKILEILKKRIAREYGVVSITKNQLVNYFMSESGERNIDESKVMEIINESLDELSEEEREKLEGYLAEEHSCGVVNQIIMNTLNLGLLESNEEKETKRSFEKIKKNWPDFVEWDSLASSFRVHHQKINEIMDSDGGEEKMFRNNVDSPLIIEPKVNQELLKRAVLAYAFSCQNIDTFPESVELRVKAKKKGNFIKQFLKLDLKELTLNEKGKIGCGIGYTKEFNTLHFHGVAKSDIKNKVIVVQIANLKHRILKELWIYGEKRSQRFGKENNKGEIFAARESYQVL